MMREASLGGVAIAMWAAIVLASARTFKLCGLRARRTSNHVSLIALPCCSKIPRCGSHKEVNSLR
eukprot:3514717-Amphidinium_carterae.1